MERNPSERDKFLEARKSGKLMGRKVPWDLCVCCSFKIRIWRQPDKKVPVVILPLKVLLNSAYDLVLCFYEDEFMKL